MGGRGMIGNKGEPYRLDRTARFPVGMDGPQGVKGQTGDDGTSGANGFNGLRGLKVNFQNNILKHISKLK